MGELFNRAISVDADPMAGINWTFQAAQTPFKYLFGKTANYLHSDKAHRDVGFDWEEALYTGDGVVWADKPSQKVGTVYDWAKGQDSTFERRMREKDIGSVDIPFSDHRLRLNPTVWGLNAAEHFMNPIETAGTFHATGGDLADIATVLRGRSLTGIRNPLKALGIGGDMLMEGKLHKMMQSSDDVWQHAFGTLRDSGVDTAEAMRLADRASRGMSTDQLARSMNERLAHVDSGGYMQRLTGNNLEDYFTRGRFFNRNPMLPLRGKRAYNPALRSTSFMDEMMAPVADARRPADVMESFPFDDPALNRMGRGMSEAQSVEHARIADDVAAFDSEADNLARLEKPRHLSDLVDNEEVDLLAEARKLVQAKVRGAEAQDEALGDIVTDTYRLMKNKQVIPGKDPMNYVRSTLSNTLKKWFKRENKHAAREATILNQSAGLGDEAGELVDSMAIGRGGRQARPDEILIGREAGDEISSYARFDERFSLTSKAPAAREELAKTVREMPHVAKVEDLDGGGLRLIAKNGAEAEVRFVSDIDLDDATLAGLQPGQGAAGRFLIDVNGKGQIDLSRLANIETPDHEVVHWARELGLFEPQEWDRLTKRFAKGLTNATEIEEKIADGLAKSRMSEAGLIQRIKDWFSRIYEAVSGRRTAAGTIKRWQKGEMFDRQIGHGAGNLLYPRARGGKSVREFVANTPELRYGERKRLLDTESAFERKVIQKFRDRARSKSARYSLVKEQPDWVTDGMGHIEGPDFRGALEKTFDSVESFAKKAKDDWRGALKGLWDTHGAPRFTQRDIAVTKNLKAVFDRLQSLDSKMAGRFAMDPETIYRNTSRMVGRIGEVISGRQALKVMNDKTGELKILYEKSMFEELQKPIREFLTTKHGKQIPEGAAKELYEYADSYSAAKRVIREVDDMQAQLRRMASGEDYNAHVFEKLGIDSAVKEGDLGAIGKAIDEWGASSTPQGLDWHLRFVEWADQQDFADALKAKQKAHEGINRAVLEYAYRKRLISEDVFKHYIRNADAYSPLKRVFEELDKADLGKEGTVFKKLKGSERDIKSPTAALIENAHRIMTASDKNEAMMRLVEIAQKHDMSDLVEIAPVKVGELARAGDTTAWLDGKQYRVRFKDPEAATQLERMRKVDNPNLFKDILRLPAKMLRASTALDPFFALLRNRIRDVANLPIITKHGATWAEALAKMSPEDYKRYYESGAGFGGWMHDAEKAFIHDQARFMREMGRGKNTIFTRFEDFVDTLKKGADKLEGLTAKSEAKTRYAEWKKAVEWHQQKFPDASLADAEAYAARTSAELMDFHQSGEWIRIINQYIPFVNPRVQGARVLMKSLQRDPGRFGKQLAIRVGLPSIGTYLMAKAMGREEEYQNLPAYRRDYFWNIPGPAGTWITIPKPFEAGVMGTFFERGLDRAAGNKRAFDGYTSSLMDAFAPLTSSDVAGPLKPFQEILSNKNAWTGEYIVPPHEEDLDPRLRKGAERASRLGRLMAGMFGGVMPGVDDPRQFEHLLQGLTSGYGRFATNLSRIGQGDGGKSVTDLMGGATGMLRKSSPYTLGEVQDVLSEQERKGMTRDKGARAFRAALRKAREGKITTQKLLRLTRRERKRVDSVTIEDVLKKRKKRGKR